MLPHDHVQGYDVQGHVQDILDTWAPGNFIVRGNVGTSPLKTHQSHLLCKKIQKEELERFDMRMAV
jgi:hypothetical protein